MIESRSRVTFDGPRVPHRIVLPLVLLISASHCLRADHPPAGKIRIADRPGDDFASIQAAIDAAAAGATVLVGQGATTSG